MAELVAEAEGDLQIRKESITIATVCHDELFSSVVQMLWRITHISIFRSFVSDIFDILTLYLLLEYI